MLFYMVPIKYIPAIEAKKHTVIEQYSLKEKEKMCLARNLFYEARGEGEHGMVLVGHVTLNRMKSPRYPNSICEVVYQPKQFSWTMKYGRTSRPQQKNPDVWKKTVALAERVYEEHKKGIDPTGSAKYFYNPTLANPRWASAKTVTARHGQHVFLR